MSRFLNTFLLTCLLLAAVSAVTHAQGSFATDSGRANQRFADARTLEQRGELEQAYEAYRDAWSLDPGHYRALYRAGRILHRLDRHPEAIVALQTALAIAPDFYPAHNTLGLLFSELGYDEAAVDAFRKGMEVAPDMASAWRNYARALTNASELQQAVAAYQRAVDLEPDHEPSLIALGILQGRLGQREAALKTLQQALEVNPANAVASEALAWVKGETSGKLTDSSENKTAGKTGAGRSTEKRIFFEEGGNFTESGLFQPPPLKLESPLLLRDRGVRLIHDGHYRLGVEALEEARRYGEHDPVLFSELGYAYYQLKNYESAAWAYGMAAEESPAPEGWQRLNQAIALRTVGDLPGATKAIERAIDIDPGLAHAHYLHGLVLLEQDKLTDAARAFRSAVKLDPHNVSVHLSLGATLAARGQRSDAIKAYRQALRVDPGNAEALFSVAPLLEAQGRLDEAIDAYEALEIATANEPELAAWHTLAGKKITELAHASTQPAAEVSGDTNRAGLPFWNQ